MKRKYNQFKHKVNKIKLSNMSDNNKIKQSCYDMQIELVNLQKDYMFKLQDLYVRYRDTLEYDNELFITTINNITERLDILKLYIRNVNKQYMYLINVFNEQWEANDNGKINK